MVHDCCLLVSRGIVVIIQRTGILPLDRYRWQQHTNSIRLSVHWDKFDPDCLACEAGGSDYRKSVAVHYPPMHFEGTLGSYSLAYRAF